MKRIFAILGAAAALAACTQAPKNEGPTVFGGRFIGYNNEYVEFFLPQDDGSFKEIKLDVAPDGSFCDTVEFDKDYFDAPLFADKFMFRICVERGKTYDATFDITDPGVETNFSFNGEGAAENEFLKHLWAKYEPDAIEDVTTFKDCRKALDDIYGPLRAELKTVSNKGFVKYYTAELASRETRTSFFFPFFAAKATGTCPQDADFDAFVKKAKLNDDRFQEILPTVFTNAAYMCDGIDVTEALKAAESCAVSPGQKESAMVQMISALLGAGNTAGLAEGYEYISGRITDPELAASVDEACSNALMLAPGIDAPDIEFEDIEGNVHHLAELKGKPVYIDLWASWCGPCCQEIPFLAKYVESLGKDPEILCVSISIDDNRSDWTAKLEEEKSSWPQYIATKAGQESISGKYFVSGIPRFMLLDAEGRIVSVNAPRPSEPEFAETIKSML